MKSVKKNFVCSEYRETTYVLPNNLWHREDGPAFFRKYQDGRCIEKWFVNGLLHKFGGPSIILTYVESSAAHRYCVYGNDVTDEVEQWSEKQDYDLEDLSDIEKWELELFMRSL